MGSGRDERRLNGALAALVLGAGALGAQARGETPPPAPELVSSSNAGVRPDAAAPDPLALPTTVTAAGRTGLLSAAEREGDKGASPGSVPLALSSSQPAAAGGHVAGGDPPAVVFDIGGAADPIAHGPGPGREMEFAAEPTPPARSFDFTARPDRGPEADGHGPPKSGASSVRLARRTEESDLQVMARADLDAVIKVAFPDAGQGAKTTSPAITILPLTGAPQDEPDDSRDVIDTLTLGDYVIRAIRRSESLAAERFSVKAAKLQAVSQLANLGPHVQFNWEQGHEHSYSSVGSTPVTDPNHLRTDAIALLTQPIFDPVTLAALDRDRETARGAEMKRRMAEVNASYEAVAAYFDLLNGRLQLELARTHLKRMNDLLDYMKRRTELGGSSEADLQRVQAVALSAERNEVDARAGLDTALSNLRRLAGVTAVQIAAPNIVEAQVPRSSEEAYRRLIRTNPDLRWAYIQIKVAHDDSLSAAAQLLPKISFNLGRYANTNASGAQGTTVDTRALFTGQLTFGAGVEVAQSLSQSAHAEALKHQYYDLLRSAQDRMRTLYLTLNSLDGQRAIAWKEFKANDKVTAAFDEQLFAANRSILDVLDTYLKYYQSKANIVQLTMSQIKTAYQIRQLVGDLDRDSVDPPDENAT